MNKIKISIQVNTKIVIEKKSLTQKGVDFEKNL